MAPEFTVYVPLKRAEAFRASLGAFGAEVKKVQRTRDEKYLSLGIDKESVMRRIQALGDEITPEQEELVRPAYERLTENLFGYREEKLSLDPVRFSDFRRDISHVLLTIVQINPRDALALVERYGLETGEGKTFRQTGAVLGTSGARDIVIRGLKRMRHPTRLKFLRPYLPDYKE